MESEIGDSDHMVARTFAVIFGLALAALLTNLSLSALSPLNSTYAGIGLMFAAIGLGLPLFLITLCITIYLAYKRSVGPVLAIVTWLPVLASLAIIPVSEFFRVEEMAAYASTHPTVTEIHVNLTGRDLRFDPVIGPHPLMEGTKSDDFLEVRRDPASNRGDKMAAYRGVLLAPDFKSMQVIYGPPGKEAATSVPVMVAPTPAHWTPFIPELGTRLARLMVHFYYHYPDRVEVASVIDWDDGNTREYNNGKPASGLFIHNLTSETVVRLEVNGETVPFYWGLTPLRGEDCTVSHSTAVLGANPKKLTVRWQTAQSAPIWNEATPTVPTFRNPIPAGSSVTSKSVHLFLQQDGQVTVQRAQTYSTPARRDSVRASEPLPAFKAPPACGDAVDQYPPMLERSPV